MYLLPLPHRTELQPKSIPPLSLVVIERKNSVISLFSMVLIAQRGREDGV